MKTYKILLTDSHYMEYSIQESSVDSHLWVGIENPYPEVLTLQGWEPVDFPTNTLFHSRMHLTRKQVKQLVWILIKYLVTGKLEQPNET